MAEAKWFQPLGPGGGSGQEGPGGGQPPLEGHVVQWGQGGGGQVEEEGEVEESAQPGAGHQARRTARRHRLVEGGRISLDYIGRCLILDNNIVVYFLKAGS